MAKVLNNPFGQLSGKVGGVVFARNKGGSYMRANVKGLNPQTQAQVQARNNFASVSTLFRNLNGAEKTSWQEFADNYYSPRGGGNVGQFSGYNAFIALRSAVQQSYNLGYSGTIEVNGAPLPGFTSEVEFTAMPDLPIAKNFSSGLALSAGGSVQMSIDSAKMKPDGQHEIIFQVGDGSGLDLTNNVDVNGYNLGYAVYISNGNPAPNLSYSNPHAVCLGYCRPWISDDAPNDMDAVETITVTSPSALDIGRYKRFPLVEEYCLMTIYAINKYGMFTIIGSKEVWVESGF